LTALITVVESLCCTLWTVM